jgi:LCP family protein required for cell wall assembly
MADNKHENFWKTDSWWSRHFGFMSFEAKCWFLIVLAIMMAGGLYLGFWFSCQQENPIDVPYVTATNYYENKEAAKQAAKDFAGDDGILTVLLLGCDMREGESVGRSDTIMLAFVNMEGGSINLLSIPRDTRVELAEGKGTTKINHAFAYGGVALTRKTIESFLDVEIDRYVIVDFEGFSDIIDALGGIDYDVEQRMYRPSENIDLQPGFQHLNGYNALAYVRWRGTATADIGRIERQQKFLKTVLEQVMSAGTIFRLPQLANTVNDAIQTDFSLKELSAIINLYKDLSEVSFNSDMLPGEGEMINGISYWQYYPTQTKELVEQMQDFSLGSGTDETDSGDSSDGVNTGA